jgi:hypothetical protein
MGTIFTDWLKTNAQTVRASELGADAVSAWIAWMQEAIPDKANVQVAGMQQAFRYGLLPGKGLSVSIKEGLNTVAEKITKEQLPGASTQTLAIANLGELTGGTFTEVSFKEFLVKCQVNWHKLAPNALKCFWLAYIEYLANVNEGYSAVVRQFGRRIPAIDSSNVEQILGKCTNVSTQLAFTVGIYGDYFQITIVWENGQLFKESEFHPYSLSDEPVWGNNIDPDDDVVCIGYLVRVREQDKDVFLLGSKQAKKNAGAENHAEALFRTALTQTIKNKIDTWESSVAASPKKVSTEYRLELFVTFECCESCQSKLRDDLYKSVATHLKNKEYDASFQLFVWCFKQYNEPLGGQPHRFFLCNKDGIKRRYLTGRHPYLISSHLEQITSAAEKNF